MNKKKIIFSITLIILLLSIGFYSTPYFSLYGIKKAIEKKDSTDFSSYINFPLLKNNLKTSLMAENQTEEGIDAFADEMLDVLITPDNLAMMMKGSIDTGRYDGFNKFVVRITKEEQIINFIFYRNGLFSWKLSNLIPQ